MRLPTLILVAAIGLTSAACSNPTEPSDSLIVYSGRSEEYNGDLVERFEQTSGIDVEMRYGTTPELAAQLLEEGNNSPAHVFWAQDAGALQVIADEGRATELPTEILDKVPADYRSAEGHWVATSGRARVMVYNTDAVAAQALPDSVLELTEPQWRGRVAIAPSNGSFQSFVTAMRASEGESATREWLTALAANDPVQFESNTEIVEAVDAGEVDLGLVNNYYWYGKAAEVGEEAMNSANATFADGDLGNLVNIAGVAALSSDPRAHQFIEFMLGEPAQEHFAEVVAEYPVIDSVQPKQGLTPLLEIDGPDVGLDELRDLRGTQAALMETGLL